MFGMKRTLFACFVSDNNQKAVSDILLDFIVEAHEV